MRQRLFTVFAVLGLVALIAVDYEIVRGIVFVGRQIRLIATAQPTVSSDQAHRIQDRLPNQGIAKQ